MTKEERNDAIEFFKRVKEKEVGGAKYSSLAIEALQNGPCENVSDINDGNIYECSCGYGWDKSKVVRHHFCPNCGRAVDNSIRTELEPCDDAISRQAVLDKMKERDEELSCICPKDIRGLPPKTPQPNKWIPITSRPMTEEEKEHYKIHPDYRDDCRIFNCKLPDDGQEVLISVCGGVELDTFVHDANDGCYFEGRDIDDVDAWMPKPTPYQSEIPTGQIVANGELYPGEFDDPLAEERSDKE